MPAPTTTEERKTKTSNQEAIRPFRVSFSDAELTDLRKRINATKWPEKEPVADGTQGVPLALMKEVARYWATDYDWRKCEAKLNALPQFITEIDGLDIHFIHVRSKHADALPVVVTHGWPGSIIEQMKIIEPLVNPTAYGGSAEDAFHVVIPSMPGYGFSGKPTATGWGPARIARAWTVLMKRLGYTKFVAQGGDWGALVTDLMGAQAPAGLAGIHTSLPRVVRSDVARALQGGPLPEGLTPEELRTVEQLKVLFTTGLGYAIEMGTRPQTLYAIADSPIGLAAWLIDHGDGGGQPAAAIVEALRRTRGEPDELTRDDVLDNVTMYWLTNTGVSSGRIYWENKESFIEAKDVAVPAAVSAFPGELFQPPKAWAERTYPKLVYYNQPAKGGHFAAWEQPKIFAEELRAGFRPMRK